MKWFDELLYADSSEHGFSQRFKVTSIVHQVKSEHQDLIIFETPFFGRVLAIDNIVQTTEKDEFTYHEMLAHVPIFAHGSTRRALIIGGGDGGLLREVLRHKDVELVRMVEIDASVIDICREYLPAINDGAFDDDRADVVIADGCAYVAETDEKFDIILIDSTDPVGLAEVLFTEQFYTDCRRCLAEGGILATQNGVPLTQSDELVSSHKRLSAVFQEARFYLTVVPTYIGGFMALGWATDDEGLSEVGLAILEERYRASGIETRYYSPDIHRAAFVLPPFISDMLVA